MHQGWLPTLKTALQQLLSTERSLLDQQRAADRELAAESVLEGLVGRVGCKGLTIDGLQQVAQQVAQQGGLAPRKQQHTAALFAATQYVEAAGVLALLHERIERLTESTLRARLQQLSTKLSVQVPAAVLMAMWLLQ